MPDLITSRFEKRKKTIKMLITIIKQTWNDNATITKKKKLLLEDKISKKNIIF